MKTGAAEYVCLKKLGGESLGGFRLPLGLLEAVELNSFGGGGGGG